MKVKSSEIRKVECAIYTLWDGEMEVTVHRGVGAYGFWSAAMVIIRINSPIEVRNESFYKTQISRNNPALWDMTPDECDELRQWEMDRWIADQLTELSTGKDLNDGASGSVEGLN